MIWFKSDFWKLSFGNRLVLTGSNILGPISGWFLTILEGFEIEKEKKPDFEEKKYHFTKTSQKIVLQ